MVVGKRLVRCEVIFLNGYFVKRSRCLTVKTPNGSTFIYSGFQFGEKGRHVYVYVSDKAL